MSKSFCYAGHLIDGTGSPARKSALLCMENGLISSLEFHAPEDLPRVLPPLSGAPVQSYPDCTILPGLIDSHVHLAMSGKTDPELRAEQLRNGFEQNRPLIAERIRQSLGCGIMALRDGGDAGGHALEYVRANPRSSVQVKCAGRGWRARGRYGKIIGREPLEGLTLAESIAADRPGGDHVKILNSGINSLTEFGRETAPQFDREQLRAAFAQAKKQGKKIMVHANGTLPVEFAIEAGCDSIEHGFFMGEENLRKMADKQIFWVPTAVTMKALLAQSKVAARILETQLDQMRRARALGVPIASGTDAGSFGVRHGQALVEEFKLMVQAGFSIEETICGATRTGARLLGLDHELGLLRPGMPASFLVVPGPPSELPGSLISLKSVFIRGMKSGMS